MDLKTTTTSLDGEISDNEKSFRGEIKSTETKKTSSTFSVILSSSEDFFS